MDIESKTVSADGKIADIFKRVNRLIADRHKVDVGGQKLRMLTILELCNSNGTVVGTTSVPLIRGKAEYQGKIKVTFHPELVDIPPQEFSKEAQNQVLAAARLEAARIGDLGIHNLMNDIVNVFVAQGAIIQPGAMTKVVDIHYRGFVYEQEMHRFISGYFSTRGRTKCMYFEIDRSFTKKLKIRRRLTQE